MPSKSLAPEDIFTCKKCGDCCKGYGGTYVTPENIAAIASYIHTDPETFLKNYCQISGGKPVLAVDENGWCVFFDETCTIHPVKPAMCRAWPFIKSVLKDVQNWHIMAGVCMGIRTNFPDEAILACVRKMVEEG
jgi:Fe-S-cluster containining protein